MSKKSFYGTCAVYITIGLIYVGAMFLNVYLHNYNATCGYFCAVCCLAVAFMWYCNNKELRDRLPKCKERTYMITLIGFYATGGIAHMEVPITTTCFTKASLDLARQEFINYEKENYNIILNGTPIVISAILLDEG